MQIAYARAAPSNPVRQRVHRAAGAKHVVHELTSRPRPSSQRGSHQSSDASAVKWNCWSGRMNAPCSFFE